MFHLVVVICVIGSPEGSLSFSAVFSYSSYELWFCALLSLLPSLTMRNSVCSRAGGGADTERHRKRGKEQPAVEHQRKEKRE